jgi:glycosyltransferase involved in cell wall biosynthesis
VKILVLNWKDPHHPLAGGAEYFSFNLLSRIAAMGHEVTWFTSIYPGAGAESVENGIRYVRSGSIYTVHSKARSYLASLPPADLPDVVLDEVNTRPFDPARALPRRVPVVNLIHQLAREIWWSEVPFPLAFVGRYILEDRWLRRISRHPTLTISESTRKDLTALGFRNVRIVPVALEGTPEPFDDVKPVPPHLLYIGRLTKGKGAEDALEAFCIIRRTVQCSMTVVGDGPLLPRLAHRYSDIAQFTGRVDGAEKQRLLGEATILLVPGTREGWGLVVLEAQSRGAVPIVYNVPGLRDSVDFGRSGLLSPHPSPSSMALATCDLLSNPNRLHQLAREGWKWCQQFTYDRATREFLQQLTDQEFLGS